MYKEFRVVLSGLCSNRQTHKALHGSTSTCVHYVRPEWITDSICQGRSSKVTVLAASSMLKRNMRSHCRKMAVRTH